MLATDSKRQPHVFGVRHLSPAASYHLLELLEEIKPKAVLIEGPSDASEWMRFMAAKDTRPPIAILAYTNTMPVRTIMYPFSEYSPEYTAICWGYKNQAITEFIDLPCGVFLGFQQKKEEEHLGRIKELEASSAPTPAEAGPKYTGQASLYSRWAEICGYEDYDSYWEAEFEHNLNSGAYRGSANEFGASIRQLEAIDEENLVREAYMRRRIQEVIDRGCPADKIVVVCGAYHAPVLDLSLPPMTDEVFESLPNLDCTLTLMPYSNLRLSSRTGYGAGNQSPRYFGMMWKAMRKKGLSSLPHTFFTEIARYMRKEGTFRSTAEVIEAVRLSYGLAMMRNQSAPTLDDLRMAAVTCLGQGEMSVVAKALAAVEVGTEMGYLPEGVSRTAIQDDFYHQLSDLKLDKYRSTVAQDLELDLRENRSAKTERARWNDLHRSFFLNRLALLNISFVKPLKIKQDNATWKEGWVLQWTTEAEIELVESSLKGETVELAAAYAMKENLDSAKTVSAISGVIEQASKCGMPAMLETAVSALQAFTVDTDSFTDIAVAAGDLSSTINYGDIRQTDVNGLIPLLSQLFVRGSLIVVDNSKCNHPAAQEMFSQLNTFNKVSLDHYEVVDEELWIAALREMAARDDLNPALSGYACAVLLERNLLAPEDLEKMIARRLSPGIEADLGAGWFEGLAARNRYGLLSRQHIWELLDTYIASLDDEQFTKALVFLRRTFSAFSSREKRVICDNLGGFWNIGGETVENKIAAELTDTEKTTIDSVNEFDFDDL